MNKRLVILGAGYAGVMAALGLEKKFWQNQDVSITLIDQHDYQLYTGDLHEVATAEEELATQQQLKRSLTLPLEEIFENKKVELVQANVASIDRTQKSVVAGNKTFAYDYLIVALGSVSDFFGIPGAQEFALPMKKLTDSLRIKNQIEFAIQLHRSDANKKNIRIVVGGGGYTGVEFAAELSHEIKIVTWKNGYPPEKVEIAIVEAMPQLIPGFSTRLSQDALWHLKNRGVRVELSSPIAKIDQHFVHLQNGETMEYDVLVWTTGVKAPAMPFNQPLNMDRKGRIITNQFLQSDLDPSIFVAGDCACIINADGRPAPATAQDAIEQGKYIAEALPLIMENKKPASYKGKKHGFIVTLGGRYAIFDYGGFYFKGFFAYVAREAANWNYYRQVVGLWKATKYVLLDWDVYGRND